MQGVRTMQQTREENDETVQGKRCWKSGTRRRSIDGIVADDSSQSRRRIRSLAPRLDPIYPRPSHALCGPLHPRSDRLPRRYRIPRRLQTAGENGLGSCQAVRSGGVRTVYRDGLCLCVRGTDRHSRHYFRDSHFPFLCLFVFHSSPLCTSSFLVCTGYSLVSDCTISRGRR